MLPGMLRFAVLLFILFVSPVSADELPLVDTHLHYNETVHSALTPAQIIQIREDNHISRAVITSRPPERVLTLRQQAPERIIPLLGVYRSPADKQDWYRDKTLPGRVAKQLHDPRWRGIGELHIFARHRHSPVFRQIVRLAGQYQLPLMMHADPAVIDTIYEWNPKLPVVWAHAGTYPYPDLLADYLQRYPDLMIDLSMRDERIAPEGKLRDDWYELFIRYPDQFMVGVDTFSTLRWQTYDQKISLTRHWLKQLPDDVRHKLADTNARRIFND